jgi:hypothetical protein
MRTGEQNLWLRAASVAFVGLMSIGACGAAMPENASEGSTLPAPSGAGEAEPLAKKPSKAAGASDEASRCPHGALEDPHRGFVRCLKPEERDAGWLPPPPQAGEAPKPEAGAGNTAPAGNAGAAGNAGNTSPAAPEVAAPLPKEEKPVPGPPPNITFSAPKFEGGEVPRAEKFLNGVAEGIGKCVAEGGGLKADKGTLKVTFLVRARGRAEGVEVVSVKGIGPEATACIRTLLKNRSVGAPTSDPVGVTVTVTMEKKL